MTLFLKEFKKVIFSFTFLIFVITLFVMLSSQEVLNFTDQKIDIPQPGKTDYGKKYEEIPDIIMPEAIKSLYRDFTVNSYITYPIGFYKNIILSQDKIEQMADIISYLTGISKEDLLKRVYDENTSDESINFENGTSLEKTGTGYVLTAPPAERQAGKEEELTISVKKDITYDEFKNYMQKADKILGGGSDYSDSNLISFGKVPINYNEALKNYNLIKTEDRFTGAYARLFSDYACIVISLMSVFLGISVSLKDKNIKEIIFTKNISSFQLMLSRYLAVITAIMVPVIIFSYISNISVWGIYKEFKIDYLAPLAYSIGWIMPSAMISSAVGLFFAELTGTPIATVIQVFWWFIDLNMGLSVIKGGYSPFTLSLRHNSLGNTEIFKNNFSVIVTNRLIFVEISLILFIMTVLVYSYKRKGKINVFKKFRNKQI